MRGTGCEAFTAVTQLSLKSDLSDEHDAVRHSLLPEREKTSWRCPRTNACRASVLALPRYVRSARLFIICCRVLTVSRQPGSLQGGAGFHTRFIREGRLHVQGNLETVVEFLLRLRRLGAFPAGSLAPA